MRRIILLCSTLLLLAGCAKIVTPVGGPKDITPPKVVKETPPNGSTHFSENLVKVTFDEFVTLNNTLENVLISPPMENEPTYTLSGKSLIIKFQDTLRPDQTYNIGFADCIHDYTEGNPIPFYNYAFSTGSYVDSFMLKGKVIDALTLEPAKNIFVFAYSEDIDSLPLTTRPQFVSKTQNDGTFQIKNIKEGAYKLFALKDINSNLIFDLPNEEIAFGDHTFAAVPIPHTPDTTANDTIAKDTLSADKALTAITLRLFTEEDTTQVFSKMQNKELGKYEFFYKNTITSHEVVPISGTLPDRWEIVGKDTITWYLKSALTDTVTFAMKVNGQTCDTLKITPFKKKDARSRRGSKADEQGELIIGSSNTGEIFKPIVLTFPYPIRPVPQATVTVIGKRNRAGNDTLHYPISVPDTLVMQIAIKPKLEEKVPYSIIIKDSVFQGYNDCYNDSTIINFTQRTAKDYGSLRMQFELPATGYAYIVQLLNEKGNIIQSNTLTANEEIFYSQLLAGRYKVKVIEDRNGNGVWDTGHYRSKTQPERTQFFKGGITVRGFWELNETFEWE